MDSSSRSPNTCKRSVGQYVPTERPEGDERDVVTRLGPGDTESVEEGSVEEHTLLGKLY